MFLRSAVHPLVTFPQLVRETIIGMTLYQTSKDLQWQVLVHYSTLVREDWELHVK